MRIRKSIAVTIALLYLSVGYAANLKKLFKLFEKGQIEKAIELLEEEISNEPDNSALLWVAAKITSTDSLSYYNIDSAYILVKRALVTYDSADAEFLETFSKLGYERLDIVATDIFIRELQWERVKKILTIEAIRRFREMYPESPQNTKAIYLRDSLAYQQVTEVHSWHAYSTYIKLYPNSAFYTQARDNYDKLLFGDKTKNDSYKEHRQFVNDYPESPYREISVGKILEYQLKWNNKDSLIHFIDEFPETKHLHRAFDYLYHLDQQLLDARPELFIKHPKRDSLSRIHALNQNKVFILPTSSGARLMSIDQTFEKELAYRLIGESVFCDVYEWDFLAARDQISGDEFLLTREGEEFYQGQFLNYLDVGLGMVWVGDENGGLLIHKTGDIVAKDIQEARPIGDHWIMIKRANKWSMIALNGNFYSPFIFDDIAIEGNFWIFEKDGLFAFSNTKQISTEIGKGGFTLLFKYDDYELVNDDLMIGFKDEMEGMINSKLEFVVPWAKQTIYPNPLIPYSKKGDRYYVYTPDGQIDISQSFDHVLVNQKWIALKQEKWKIAPLSTLQFESGLDSVRLIGNNALYLKKGDSTYLIFENEKIQLKEEGSIVTLNPTIDGQVIDESYILLSDKKNTTVLDITGKQLLSGGFKEIKALGDSLFAIRINQKTGIMNAAGNWVVKDNYDFIQRRENSISLLKDRKIGVYSIEDSTLINPGFTNVLDPVGDYYRTGSNGYFGLIDKEGAQKLSFSYRHVESINDSLYWVKTDSSWQIINVNNELIYQFGIISYEKTSYDVQFYKTLTQTGYGLMTSLGSYIIPPTFSDIRIVSDGEDQLIIGEKSVPEAGYHIWVGFNNQGERIFSEAYKEVYYNTFNCE